MVLKIYMLTYAAPIGGLCMTMMCLSQWYLTQLMSTQHAHVHTALGTAVQAASSTRAYTAYGDQWNASTALRFRAFQSALIWSERHCARDVWPSAHSLHGRPQRKPV